MTPKEYIAALHELPCMINNNDCHGGIEAHHLTDGGRRMGDQFSIPLCQGHHGSPFSNLKMGDAYHKGTKAWVRKHGCQKEMLVKTWALVGYEPSEDDLRKIGLP